MDDNDSFTHVSLFLQLYTQDYMISCRMDTVGEENIHLLWRRKQSNVNLCNRNMYQVESQFYALFMDFSKSTSNRLRTHCITFYSIAHILIKYLPVVVLIFTHDYK